MYKISLPPDNELDALFNVRTEDLPAVELLSLRMDLEGIAALLRHPSIYANHPEQYVDSIANKLQTKVLEVEKIITPIGVAKQPVKTQ